MIGTSIFKYDLLKLLYDVLDLSLETSTLWDFNNVVIATK